MQVKPQVVTSMVLPSGEIYPHEVALEVPCNTIKLPLSSFPASPFPLSYLDEEVANLAKGVVMFFLLLKTIFYSFWEKRSLSSFSWYTLTHSRSSSISNPILSMALQFNWNMLNLSYLCTKQQRRTNRLSKRVLRKVYVNNIKYRSVVVLLLLHSLAVLLCFLLKVLQQQSFPTSDASSSSFVSSLLKLRPSCAQSFEQIGSSRLWLFHASNVFQLLLRSI